VHSEWAEIAVLQPHWRRGGPKLTIAYANRRTRVELEIGRELISSGDWELEVQFDGEPTEFASNWEEVCWLSDKDVDYVEIEAKLTRGLKVQRQILLTRKERCLFMADAVLSERSGTIQYRGRWPLAAAVAVEPAVETREVWLAGRKARLAVLPLALSEWRSERRFGDLVSATGGLALSQMAEARRLYAPLFVDLDPDRSALGVTWRHLTVGEARQVQPAEVAVGYRGQTGNSQWLVYRSLADVAGRTVLGQNLSTEFLFGRFRPSGDVNRLIEIE
jgi:hypothetical protein